ncbi:MAG: gliding motility-associated C-terminal domain-containing protein [Cytophagaceae bacterium]|jgi:gliding motility-associated-like protein|nr:gliding motility-associated C-terminal domain-containing protein [Cytophagaceae bacterium]
MTVNPNLPASVSIAADQNPICAGTNVTFTATPTNGGGAPTYQWKLNGTNVGTNATTYSNNNLTNGDVVTLEMTSNATCATGSPATSNAVTMTVNALSIGGSVNSDASVCFGLNNGTLNLSGHSGTIIAWEFSLDNFNTPGTSIANTGNSQNYLNLTTTTSYRALVQSGVCPVQASTAATITVAPALVGGSIVGTATVCNGNNTGVLTLTGHTGTIVEWVYSYDNFLTPGISIANTTNTFTYSNLTQTTSYRVRLQSGSCASTNSAAATITVVASPPVPSGTGGSVCGSGSLTLTGSGASVYRWYDQSSGGTLLGSAATYTTPVLTVTTTYYLSSDNGSGCESSRVPVTATVVNAPVGGTLTGPDTVLAGNNSITLSLSGHSGTIQQWETSTDGIAFTPLTNAGSTLSLNNIVESTYYRVVVTNTPCALVYSTILKVNVVPDSTLLQELVVAPGLSPNGDGINDAWVINKPEGKKVSLEVFNRWGNLVYENDDYNNDWEGKANNGLVLGNQALPDGTYFYVIKVDGLRRTGYLTLKY